MLAACYANRALLDPGSGYEQTTQNGRFFFVTNGDDSGFSTFQLVDASVSGTPKIRVVYGIVAHGGGSTIPDGMNPGDVPPYILTGMSGAGFVWLDISATPDGMVQDVSIGFGAHVPANEPGSSGSPGDYFIEIGSYNLTGSTLTLAQGLSGSIDFALCGGVTPEYGTV